MKGDGIYWRFTTLSVMADDDCIMRMFILYSAIIKRLMTQ